jgi:hypothetical protein
MKPSTADLEQQLKVVRDSVESGLEQVDRYGRPFLERHGRKVLAITVISLIAVGAAVAVARRQARHRPLTVRLQEALPDAVSSRLERPLSSIRSAAGRIGR